MTADTLIATNGMLEISIWIKCLSEKTISQTMEKKYPYESACKNICSSYPGDSWIVEIEEMV